MKNSSYNSVPVIASVIGSKTRKAMYLTNITSLDGKRIYKDKWIPTSWSTNNVYQWRYTNKERGIDNAIIDTGRYYKFNFKDSVLMTEQGAVNEHGAILEVKGLTKVKLSNSRQTIEWEYDSQSLVEFPMNRVTGAMLIEQPELWDNNNVSLIKSRLVDGKVVDYYQIKDRYVIHIPTWLIKNFEERYTSNISIEDNFDNDDKFYGVAEDTAKKSMEQLDNIDIARDSYGFVEVDSLTQWEYDNPEYKSYF